MLVVGAGITGALAAHELSRTGANVIVVDRRGITFSVIAAQIIAGAVAGRPHDSARWFSFDR